ncbi:MAG TPA: hypothetical protein ENJ28_04830 [Gammaproteobacteria bacterium]|nr:hypothetical protein [Gammaproteobacteria bacterium]
MLSQILTEDCFMLDIETTGLSTITNAITSVCLVRFNLNTPDLFSSIIDSYHVRLSTALNTDMLRTNAIETMQFRQDHDIAKYEEQLNVVNTFDELNTDLQTYLKQTNLNTRHVFALHTEFDIAFLKGYYSHFARDFPFHYKNISDLPSLISGMDLDFKEIRDTVDESNVVTNVGAVLNIPNFEPHNALYDCIRQIAFLRNACIQKGIIS